RAFYFLSAAARSADFSTQQRELLPTERRPARFQSVFAQPGSFSDPGGVHANRAFDSVDNLQLSNFHQAISPGAG
ncbi:MAG: hypothetical protein ACM31P_20415, partial [Actinomycetota bacterium]